MTVMKEILGKKLGMTRVFTADGEAIPVTVIEAGPCPVIMRKTADREGYDAYQVAFGPTFKKRSAKSGRKRKSHVTKALEQHYAKAGVEPRRYLREIRFDEGELEVGSELKVDVFNEGEMVDVSGISRGLGFAGECRVISVTNTLPRWRCALSESSRMKI
jgi:large subunit ribosomal protein L3